MLDRAPACAMIATVRRAMAATGLFGANVLRSVKVTRTIALRPRAAKTGPLRRALRSLLRPPPPPPPPPPRISKSPAILSIKFRLRNRSTCTPDSETSG